MGRKFKYSYVCKKVSYFDEGRAYKVCAEENNKLGGDIYSVYQCAKYKPSHYHLTTKIYRKIHNLSKEEISEIRNAPTTI